MMRAALPLAAPLVFRSQIDPAMLTTECILTDVLVLLFGHRNWRRDTPASTQRNSLRKLTSNTVNSVIESNLIDWDAFINDDFDAYFKARVMALLDAIEFALGKSISDRGTEETVKRFGRSLE